MTGNKKTDRLGEVRELFVLFLKTHKLRKTPERFAVLDAVYSFDESFSSDQVYHFMLREQKFQISLATIYNTLDLLERAHLIVRHQQSRKAGARMVYYECSYQLEIHQRFLCTTCGALYEFADKSLLGAINRIKQPGFRPENYHLLVYGTCARCASRRKRIERTRKE